MAKFSQAFLNSMTNSPLQQGMFALGQTIGSAPGVAAQKSAESKAMEMVTAAIASGDPQQMLQAANAIKDFNAPEALRLADLARQATQAQKDLVLKQDEARASRGVQGGLAAISQAAARGVPLEQLNEAISSVIAQNGTQAAILNAYNEGKQKPKDSTVTSKFYDRLDEQGNTVQMEQFYQNGVPLGEARNLGVTKQPEVKFGAGITEWVDPNTNTVVHSTVQTEKSPSPISVITGQPVNVSGLIRKTGGPSTVVNMGGDSDYAKEALKLAATADASAIEQGSAAADNLYTIGEARRVLSETPEVLGTFGKEIIATKRGLLRVLDVFGVSSTDPVYAKMSEQTSNADLINVFAQEFVKKRMEATKGAISNEEMKGFLASVPNLLQTAEGYKKVLDYMEKANILAVIKGDGLSEAFSSKNIKDNVFKFNKNFNSFTRVFSPNLEIPASETYKLWTAYSENGMSPENIVFSFVDPSTGKTTNATFNELKKQAITKKQTINSLINTLFTTSNASVVY